MLLRPPQAPADPATVLAAEDLSVELGGLPVLRGISLTVRAGEAVALMGGNGSGSRPWSGRCSGLIPSERGTVRLFDVPLRGFRQWSRVGYVPQRSPAPLAGSKVREVVASGRLARRRPFVPASRDDHEAVRRALDLVGHGRSGRRGHGLSVRWPAPAGADRPRPGRRTRAAGARRADRRGRPRAPAGARRLLAGLVTAGTAVLVVLHEIGALQHLLDRAIVLQRRPGRP